MSVCLRDGSAGNPSHGETVSIQAAHGTITAAHYFPRSHQVNAVLILAPGSGGGLGPGLSIHPQPFSNIKRISAHGGLYMRLGMELASGWEVDWAYRPTGQPLAPIKRSGCIATLQFDYTLCPQGKLREAHVLSAAVDDMVACVAWMKLHHPGSTVLLGGFSFGGPVCWAACRRLPQGSVAGIASLAGSARGGPRFEAEKLDTEGGVRWHTGAALFVHGTHDSNVALQVGEWLYDTANEPKALLVARGSPHMMDSARDVVYPPFRDWLRTVGACRGRITSLSGSETRMSLSGVRTVAVGATARERSLARQRWTSRVEYEYGAWAEVVSAQLQERQARLEAIPHKRGRQRKLGKGAGAGVGPGRRLEPHATAAVATDSLLHLQQQEEEEDPRQATLSTRASNTAAAATDARAAVGTLGAGARVASRVAAPPSSRPPPPRSSRIHVATAAAQKKKKTGEAQWRQVPSKKRSTLYCPYSVPPHVLAGLVGYSE